MSAETKRPRLLRAIAAAVGAVGLGMLALPSAQAQVPYLGVDFGHGWGVGIGMPPSAYGMVPASPVAPFFYPAFYPAPVYYYYP